MCFFFHLFVLPLFDKILYLYRKIHYVEHKAIIEIINASSAPDGTNVTMVNKDLKLRLFFCFIQFSLFPSLIELIFLIQTIVMVYRQE